MPYRGLCLVIIEAACCIYMRRLLRDVMFAASYAPHILLPTPYARRVRRPFRFAQVCILLHIRFTGETRPHAPGNFLPLPSPFAF